MDAWASLRTIASLQLNARRAISYSRRRFVPSRLGSSVFIDTRTPARRRFLVQMYRWFPSILKVVTIVQPDTLVRWHRAGFRRYWRWKSNSREGRPRIEMELRALIRQMSTENQLWGAPRIHGELLNLGLASLNRPSPSTCSSDVDLQVRDGGPFCETTRRTSPPWICS